MSDPKKFPSPLGDEVLKPIDAIGSKGLGAKAFPSPLGDEVLKPLLTSVTKVITDTAHYTDISHSYHNQTSRTTLKEKTIL